MFGLFGQKGLLFGGTEQAFGDRTSDRTKSTESAVFGASRFLRTGTPNATMTEQGTRQEKGGHGRAINELAGVLLFQGQSLSPTQKSHAVTPESRRDAIRCRRSVSP